MAYPDKSICLLKEDRSHKRSLQEFLKGAELLKEELREVSKVGPNPRRPFNFLRPSEGAGESPSKAHQAGDDPRVPLVAEAGKIGVGQREKDPEE